MSDSGIFKAAVKLPANQRAAYLDQACGNNQALRQEVESLLRAHEAPGSFSDRFVDRRAVTAVNDSIAERPGTVIGPYKLLEAIGEGGMGVVYMADQLVPVRRRVALKIIKPGMDTRQVIARFEAERQALALMDHPNIAKVLDAGATKSGRPYFVMELVRGVPITTYCDKNNLSVSERLQLFVTVCQAVQHAHQKGIIHRDLKPTNVLVTLHDGVPVPKVIDFGVAKATNQQLTEKTLFTSFAQMVGTPLYMSPEQAEMSGLDVDTRSDIYSLGVLLYELLTGTTPFDGKRLNRAALDEIRRIIREEEPPKPSTRLSSMGQTGTAIASHRRVDPARLNQLVRGDLDWIVMKSLEKDRTRRYETANGLAADIRRFLTDQPVEAFPPSAAYRFRKFARRNRVVLSTTLLISVALLAGTAISTWQAVRARRAERDARDAEEVARHAEELAQNRLIAEQQAHQEARANLKRARQAVDEFFTLVSQSKLFDVPGLQTLRKELLEAAVRYYQSLLRSERNDPALLADLAVAHLRVAELYHEVDRNTDAIDALASALEVVERLRRDAPTATDQQQRVAGFWKASRTPKYLGAMPQNSAKAERTMRRFVELWEGFSHDYPQAIAFQNDLAAMYSMLANWEFHAANPLNRPELKVDAFELAHRALAIWNRLSKEHPDNVSDRENIVMVLRLMKFQLDQRGRRKEAELIADRTFGMAEQLAADCPKVPQFQFVFGECLNERGHQLELSGHAAEAARTYGRQLMLAETLSNDFPGVPEYAAMSVLAAFDLSRVLKAVGKKDEANMVAQTHLQNYLKLKKLAVDVNEPERCAALAEAFFNIGLALHHSGLLEPADDCLTWSSELYDRLLAKFPKSESYRMALGHTLWHAGFVLADRGRFEQAENAQRRALQVYDKMVADFPGESGYRVEQGYAHRLLGHLLLRCGRWSDAEGSFRSARAIYAKLSEEFPQDAELRSRMLQDNLFLADVLQREGKLQVEPDILPKAIDWQPKDSGLRSCRGQLLARLGRWDNARDDFAMAVELGSEDLEGVWYPLALLQLQAGRTNDYQRLCARLLEHFGSTDVPAAQRAIALVCRLGAQPAATQKATAQIAEKAVAHNQDDMELVGFLGECLYREGEFAGAIKRMDQSLRGDAGARSHTARLFRAMAEHKLGQTSQAQSDFKQATDWIAAHLSRPLPRGTQSDPLPWTVELELRFVRKEAEGLLQMPHSAAEPHSNQNRLSRVERIARSLGCLRASSAPNDLARWPPAEKRSNSAGRKQLFFIGFAAPDNFPGKGMGIRHAEPRTAIRLSSRFRLGWHLSVV